MTKPTKLNSVTQKKRGRPKAEGESLYIPFRLRRGRSEAEDTLIDRLTELPPRHRSRFIRWVLTTGELDPILERKFTKESVWAANALADLASVWGDEED